MLRAGFSFSMSFSLSLSLFLFLFCIWAPLMFREDWCLSLLLVFGFWCRGWGVCFWFPDLSISIKISNTLLVVDVSRQKGTKSCLTVTESFNADRDSRVVRLADTPRAALLLGSPWESVNNCVCCSFKDAETDMRGKGVMCFGNVSESCTCCVRSRRLKPPWVAKWSKAGLSQELLSQHVCGAAWTS